MTLLADLDKIRQEVESLSERVNSDHSVVTRHEEQIAGKRGISETLENLANEIQSLRRAAYWVAGIIIAGAITFAFSTLTLIH
jgi:hypothetical protein